MNPVLDRELRQRLRGRAAWVSLTLYLVVLGLILRLVYSVVSDSGNIFGGQVLAASTAGRSIFHWLLFVMLALICFIVPGQTAAAISGERERQTLVPLQISLLSARSIVVGKLLASLAFVLLLVLATLPFLSVSFLLGGVAAAEVAKGVAMVIVVAVAIAALSLACSALVRRTQTATVAAYGIVATLVIGTFVVYGAQRVVDRSATGTTAPTILMLNPFAATAEVVRGRADSPTDLTSPFTPLQDLLRREIFFQDVGAGNFGGGAGGVAVAVARDQRAVQVLAPPTIAVAPGAPVPAVPDGVAATVVPGPNIAGPLAPSDLQFPPPQGPIGPRDLRPRVAGIPFWAASLLSFFALTGIGMLVAVRRLTVPARGRAA